MGDHSKKEPSPEAGDEISNPKSDDRDDAGDQPDREVRDGGEDGTVEGSSKGSSSNDGRRKSAPAYSVSEELDALEQVLEKTAQQLRHPVLMEGMLWYGTTVLAVVLSGLVVAGLVPEYGYAIGRWIMAVGVGSATVGGGAALVYYLWRKPSLDQVAARIQRHSSQFRSDLVAALEFARGLEHGGPESLNKQGYSPSMARAHVTRTRRLVDGEMEGGSLAHCVPTRELTAPAVAFSAAVALLLVPLLFNPGWTLGVISGERLGAPVVGERVAEETIVGSMEGVFVFPSYTGRDRQFRDLGSGRIESLEGTEVHLQATLMPGEWASVEMVVESDEDDEQKVIDMTLDGGHRASATIELDGSGHYWFRAKTLEGRPVEDRTRRRIEVHSDSPPTIDVFSHDGRVVVEPDDVITFEFEASDNFGIDAIRRAHHFQGAGDDPQTQWLNIPELSDEPRRVEGQSEFDLAPLELRPKDAIVVYFEARDINTATGPGMGRSESVVLYVESPQDRHMESIASQQQVMELLVSHLGDVLESPAGRREFQDDGTYRQRVQPGIDDDTRQRRYRRMRAIHGERVGILERMGEVVDELEDDELMVPRNRTLFEGLKEQLSALQNEGDELFERLDTRADRRDLTAAHIQQVADYAADSERLLENGVLSLEDLLVSQKIDLVQQTADEIEETRERLRDLLEQYRDTDDPELREAIQREMDRLRQRLQELMSRMQMQMREMPREHVNLEAMEDMDMQSDAENLGQQLDAIEEMLDADDIDGALDALDNMGMDLDSMTGEMEDSLSQMQPQGISEFDEAVSDMMDEVSDLADMERDLEEQTREFQDELREQRSEQLEELLDPVTDELLEEIAAQKRELEAIDERPLPERDQREVEGAMDAMDSLQEMVEQQDVEQSLQDARTARDVLRSMRSTMNLSQRYANEGSPEAQALGETLEDSDRLIERADGIEETLENFMREAQKDLEPAEEQRFEELADDQQQILERANELSEDIDEQSEEFPQLQQELGPAMEGAQEAMQEAEQQLRERQIQRALDEERQAIEYLGELGDSMSNAMQQQRQQERDESGQARRSEDDEVEIPGEDSGEARERIREEMMEGMREGRADEYESQIERYFRSLVE